MMGMFGFVNGSYFVFGILIFLSMIFIFFKKLTIQQELFNLLSHIKNRSSLFLGYSKLRRILSTIFFLCGLTALLAVFYRPYFGEQNLKFQQSGRAILFALDISRSMLATDISPSRLEMSKIKIRNIVKALGPEKVALMLFSGTAVLQCPFTSDIKTFLSFVDEIDSSIISSSAQTSLMEAFLQSIEIFKRTKPASKILVMLTDGEDFSPKNPSVLDKARDEKIALLALGVGSSSGAPVPIIDPLGRIIGHEKDSSGNIVITKLDEAQLSSIVTHLGGKFCRLSYSSEDVASVTSFIESFEKEVFDDSSFAIRNEFYHFFALLSCLCFALEALFN